MNIKGQRPIPVENIPDGSILLQIAFRHGDTIYNVNMLGDTAALLVSKKVRDAVVRKGFLNIAMMNASQVTGVTMDAGTDDLEIAQAGDVEAAAAASSSRLITKA